MASTSDSSQEKPNPYATANPLSKLFFTWVGPFFKKVYKNKTLPTQDLYGILPEDTSKQCGDDIEREWKKELGKTHPSLAKALFRVYGLYYAILGIFATTEEAIKVSQPLIMGYLIDYFSPTPDVPTEAWQAYLYAAGVSGLALCLSLVHAPYFFAIQHLGMKVRVGLCTVVYRKMLKLSNTSLRETSGGQINNLMTNDVNRFDRVFIYLHYLWLGPLQVAVVGYFLYREIQLAFIPGYFVLFLLMPTQMWFGKVFGMLRRKIAVFTDKRVGIMSEIIMGMRVIKMYAWEQPFEIVVKQIRKSEIARILKTIYPLAFNFTLRVFGNRFFDVCMIITYTLTTSEIKASTIFVVVAYCNTLRSSFAGFFPQGVQLYQETKVSLKRIQTYLLLDEVEMDSSKKQKNGVTHKREENPGVSAINLQGSWEADKSNPVLQFLNFEVPKGNLMAVVGPVGSGKSSLLMALLKELPSLTGKASVQGKISYVSQEPWVFSGTVRQNILFGQEYNERKFKRILRVCALDKDIEQLADGDRTMVGERGVTLSGGQKARVNLARALYDDGDVFLLDDPLSAVDSEVGRHIFDKCIMDYLSDKPRILVTHQLQFLSAAHQILVLKEGRQEALGSLNELQEHGIDFTKLLKEYDDEEDEADDDGLITSFGSMRSIRSRAGSRKSKTGSIKEEKQSESAKMFKAEEAKKGDVSWSIYLKYFRSGTGIWGILYGLWFLLAAQVVYFLADYFLAYWADKEEASRSVIMKTSMPWTTTTPSPIMTTSDQYGDNFQLTTEQSAGLYGILVVSLLLLGFIRAFLAFRIMINASKNLHYKMFKSVVRSPILFFDTNPTGRILNRFTKDIGLMDDQLPTTFFDFVQLSLLILGVVIVNTIVNPFTILLTIPLAVIFVFFRRYSLVTTRQVKRLDGVTRSPVFSHTTSSLKGIWTIRSYHKEDKFNAEFCKHQDLHSETWFMFLATSRWFGLRLDMIMVIFTIGISIGAVPLVDFLEAGLVGLILSNTLALTNVFQYCVRQSALVENQMTAVERVIEYCKLPSEAPLEIPENTPDPSWPQSGNIAFKSMSLAYSQEMPIVLKNISCQIHAKEKIGVVGRTGAGKSSLITALFRLAEPHGVIQIDGLQTSSIGLHDLRTKLSIIPQDPVLFTGTLRYNLDPFDEHSDTNIWKALEQVQLSQVVMESSGKLEMEVGEGGSNFSVGQRQLICLARAILKHNRILILDEATANVDPRTDVLIQETIRSKFQDCTVLTIAHRLNTIMDSDRIMVLENGELKEFDTPYTLLQDKSSLLSKLVEQTGKGLAGQLLEVAKAHYVEHQQRGGSLKNGHVGDRSHKSLQYVNHSSPESKVTLNKSIEADNSNNTDMGNSDQKVLHKTSELTAKDSDSQQSSQESEKAAFDNAGFENNNEAEDFEKKEENVRNDILQDSEDQMEETPSEEDSEDHVKGKQYENSNLLKNAEQDSDTNTKELQEGVDHRATDGEKKAFDNIGFLEDEDVDVKKMSLVVDDGVCSDTSSDSKENLTTEL